MWSSPVFRHYQNILGPLRNFTWSIAVLVVLLTTVTSTRQEHLKGRKVHWWQGCHSMMAGMVKQCNSQCNRPGRQEGVTGKSRAKHNGPHMPAVTFFFQRTTNHFYHLPVVLYDPSNQSMDPLKVQILIF